MVSEERRVLGDLSEDEVESVFERAVTPAPQAPAAASEASNAGERLHTLVGRSEAQGPAAMADPDEWFLASEGKAHGPFTTAQVQERWAQGLVGPDTPCWSAEFPSWIPVCKVPALTRALAPPPPPDAPPVELKAEEPDPAPRASAALKELARKRPAPAEPAPSPAPAPAEARPAAAAVSPSVRHTAPEPRGGVPPARVALYAALSAIVGSITGAALIGAFAVQLLQVSPAPALVPEPVTVTPAPPAPAPAPAAVAAPAPPPPSAAASTAAAPTVHTAPTPVVPPPKARAAVERPKRSAPARKPAPKPESDEPRHKSRYAPMPKEDPAVAEDFERMFGVPGDEG